CKRSNCICKFYFSWSFNHHGVVWYHSTIQ
ncbi:hypothetical protein CISIN_1g0024292mg, partial [Citrus sinensis]